MVATSVRHDAAAHFRRPLDEEGLAGSEKLKFTNPMAPEMRQQHRPGKRLRVFEPQLPDSQAQSGLRSDCEASEEYCTCEPLVFHASHLLQDCRSLPLEDPYRTHRLKVLGSVGSLYGPSADHDVILRPVFVQKRLLSKTLVGFGEKCV